MGQIPTQEHSDNSFEYPMQNIYAIEQRDGYCKIGVSTNADSRKRTIETQGGFSASNFFCSEPISNGYLVESSIHKHLSKIREIGEWFNISFSDAVSVINEFVQKTGDKNKRYLTSEPLEFYKLPENFTKWFLGDSPELYEWFIANGYTAYYDDVRDDILVHSEDEEFEDISFRLFAAITAHPEGTRHGLPPDQNDAD